MKFKAFGHRNLLGTHKTTLEFTKDKELTKKGNCIIGVNADFSDIKIPKSKIKITLKVDNLMETIICEINKDFNDKNEIVIRKSNFNSKRTLGIKADKAAIDINREMIKKLKNPKQTIYIELTTN